MNMNDNPKRKPVSPELKERMKEQQQLIRLIAIDALGGKCVSCGQRNKLHFHHLNGVWKDNNVKNIVLLCTKCHNIIHAYTYSLEDQERVQKGIEEYQRQRYG